MKAKSTTEQTFIDSSRTWLLKEGECRWKLGEIWSRWLQAGATTEHIAKTLDCSEETVRQYTRTYDNCKDKRKAYPSLSWSHFNVSRGWSDQECWLITASKEKLSKSQMVSIRKRDQEKRSEAKITTERDVSAGASKPEPSTDDELVVAAGCKTVAATKADEGAIVVAETGKASEDAPDLKHTSLLSTFQRVLHEWKERLEKAHLLGAAEELIREEFPVEKPEVKRIAAPKPAKNEMTIVRSGDSLFSETSSTEIAFENQRLPMVIAEHLNTEDFCDAYLSWLQIRKGYRAKGKKGLPITKRTVSRDMRLLAQFEVDVAVEIIDTTIDKGWQGLIEGKKSLEVNPTRDQAGRVLVAQETGSWTLDWNRFVKFCMDLIPNEPYRKKIAESVGPKVAEFVCNIGGLDVFKANPHRYKAEIIKLVEA